MNHPDTLRAVAALDDAGKDTEALRQFPLTTAPAGVAAAEITLRDHFAGQALVGLLASLYRGPTTPAELAARAYELADAMLETRAAP